ncbi:Trp biosynthesis-associated membrane protein [Pseudonocardia nigra]|uniref:Trp biosynthesis-associated membrane protein n=1 Tax=Pseudonocardia nigra TaxID=1921578 RepID=UPI001C5ED4BC|nr:Trp biosynthesis-associated membrane protein [Pseudonocardia nigra]
MTEKARSPRSLLGICAALAVAAGLLWGGSAAVWYRVTAVGGEVVELTGGHVAAWLTGVALLALAGIAGVVATGGVLRRLVGLLFAVVGFGMNVIVPAASMRDPYATDAPAASLPQPPPGVSVEALRYQPVEATLAPVLVIAGGVAMLMAGLFVIVWERRLPRFGARYSAPGARRVEPDPDRAAWQELDAGRDPTAERPEAAGDDPDDGRRSSDV